MSPPTLDNLILLSLPQAKILAEKGKEAFDPEIISKIESRISWAKQVCGRFWEESVGDDSIRFYNKGSSAAIDRQTMVNRRNEHLYVCALSAVLSTSMLALGLLKRAADAHR